MTTCIEFLALERRYAQESEYWQTPTGIKRRIKTLAQDFTYRLFNNAVRVVGEKNGAKWLRWIDFGDANVCPVCLHHSTSGGRGGFYRIDWFTPMLPVHDGCRCEWEVWFVDPFEQTRLGARLNGLDRVADRVAMLQLPRSGEGVRILRGHLPVDV